jgi:hypothetical protein
MSDSDWESQGLTRSLNYIGRKRLKDREVSPRKQVGDAASLVNTESVRRTDDENEV